MVPVAPKGQESFTEYYFWKLVIKYIVTILAIGVPYGGGCFVSCAYYMLWLPWCAYANEVVVRYLGCVIVWFVTY